MRVFIEDNAFASGEHALALISLFDLGLVGRHSILCDEEGTAFRAWLSARPRVEQEQVRTALDASVSREAARPSALDLRVGAGWLSPREAKARMEKPLVILLENGTRDAGFLQAVARPEHREALKQARQETWVEVAHAGGLPEVPRAIERVPEAIRRQGRCFLVIDSDALVPGRPSHQSTRAGEVGEEVLGRDRVHRLRRRSAENYLPAEAFDRWLQAPRGEREDVMGARVEAWKRLEVSQQRHLNVKDGLFKDRGRLQSDLERGWICAEDVLRLEDGSVACHVLFRSTSREDMEALGPGFGRNIVEDFSAAAAWYEANGRWREGDIDEEFTPLLDRILRAM